MDLLTEEPIHAPLCALDFSQKDGLVTQTESPRTSILGDPGISCKASGDLASEVTECHF